MTPSVPETANSIGMLSNILVSFFTSLAASVTFIFILLFLGKPKFQIANDICARADLNDPEHRMRYTFKIVNLSRFHAFDTEIELRKLTPVLLIGANSNLVMESLPYKSANLKHIPRFRKNHSEKDPFKLYANLIHTYENLTEHLDKEGTFIELKVTVRHGLTGLADTFIGTFADTNCIKMNSKFNFGNKVDTMPYNKTM